MDTKSVGNIIAVIRKKHNMTQLDLARQLNVSDKTVSKWEIGQGYPDITVFPKLASLFGVSIDYLMLGEKKGIAVAGSIIADVVKNIDVYPQVGMMSYVSEINKAVGGCVPNVSINLAKIDGSIPISAYGKIGADDNGTYIVSQLLRYGISIDGISLSSKTSTSFCDVMSMPSGERTFFHKKGANAEFSPQDIDIRSLNCRIFHIGYLLLLDMFEMPEKKYGTLMAKFLHDLQKCGIKTSIDVVSDSVADYGEKIKPVLKYCDYAIMNETECCRIFDYDAFSFDGQLNTDTVKKAMYDMAECGVKEKIIVHSRRISFLLDVKSGEFVCASSIEIPEAAIKGRVGAGDAFCAGCLYGLYNDFGNSQILDFASAAAACSLFSANSVGGMQSKKAIIELAQKYGRLLL